MTGTCIIMVRPAYNANETRGSKVLSVSLARRRLIWTCDICRGRVREGAAQRCACVSAAQTDEANCFVGTTRRAQHRHQHKRHNGVGRTRT
jgi:hypothetical protein